MVLPQLPSSITPAVLDKVINLLVPLFILGVGGDQTIARHAAGRMLAACNVETEFELSLAAEIVCFSFGALEACSQSMNPELSPGEKRCLRGSANALQRSANQCQRTLNQLRKERKAAAESSAEILAEPPAVLPTAQTLTLSNLIQAAANLGPETGLSRQQRRAIQHKVDKIQRKQAETARLVQARALRNAAAMPPLVAARAPPPAQAMAV